MRQEVQTAPTCLGYVSGPSTGPTVTKPASCVENRRWTFGHVTYATLNVQGSCNNLCDTAPDPAEFAARKPVVLVYGDSHYFRVDKPLQDAQGRRVENFTRVETFADNAANGLNDVHWVKVLVDPKSRDVFAFQPQIVPANRVAVPAP